MLCSNPECRQHTVGSHESKDKSTSIGIGAHIEAASQGGARYNANQSAAERSSFDNAIWLCSICATLIDKDEKKFPVALLQKWKTDVDNESADRLKVRTVAAAVPKSVTSKPSLAERAAANKAMREKELTRNAFLRTPEALDAARSQVERIITK